MRTWHAVAAAALLLVLAAACALAGGLALSPRMADETTQATSGGTRYQFIALPTNTTQGVPTSHDRYLVDTATGEVWVWPARGERGFLAVPRVASQPAA